MWDWLQSPENRSVIGWIASGVAAVTAAGWAVFLHRHRTREKRRAGVSAHRGIAAGRDIKAHNIDISENRTGRD